jgi:hypothetical protein
MKPSHLVLGLAVLAGAAQAQPVTEAVDPAMIRARDFLQQLDRGEYEQALVGADERLAKRGAERFASDVQKERRGVAMPSCREGLYVEILNDGAETSFVSLFGNDRVTEKVTLKYDDANALHPTEYRITGAPRDSKACSG